MKFRGTRTDLWLVALATALLGAWFLLPSAGDEDPYAFSDWSDISALNSFDISVRRGSEQAQFHFDREASAGSRYVLRNRPNALPDPAALDRLINALGHLEVLRAVEEPNEKLGLTRPSLVIEFASASELRRVALGAVAPSPPEARYVELSRGKDRLKVVLGSRTAQALDVELESLFDRRVVDWLPSEFRRVDFTSDSVAIRLERSRGGRWLSLEDKSRARRRVVEGFLLTMTELTLTRELDPSEAAAAQRGAALRRYTLHASRDDRNEALDMSLGGTCPGSQDSTVIVVTGSRHRYGCVDAQPAAKLVLGREGLVDDAAFSFRADEVERLNVKERHRSWSLTRRESAFRLLDDVETPISLQAGNSLLEALTTVRGEVVGTCRFSTPDTSTILALRSFVVGDGDAATDRIELGPMGDEGQRRLCRDDGVALLLRGESAIAVEVTPELLRDPTLLDLPLEAIREVRIATTAGRQLLQRDAKGALTLAEPKRRLADAAAIETLREHLAHLRATRWLTRAVAPCAEPTRGLLEFVVDVDGDENADAAASSPPRQHRLKFCSSDAGFDVGWFDEQPTPFRLEASLGTLLDGLLLDRSYLRLTSDDRVVTLSRGPDQIRMRRESNGWAFEVKGPPPFTPRALAAELENLQAVAVYDPARSPSGEEREPPLRVEYGAASGRVRMRFELGAVSTHRGQPARFAISEQPRLTFVLPNATITNLLGLFPSAK